MSQLGPVGRRTGPRSAWFAGIAVAAFLAGTAHAQTSYAIDVHAAALEPALLALASQTKQQIFFPRALVAGRRAPALKGAFTPEAALDQLLVGTDLRARRVNAKLIVVERTGANSAEADSTDKGAPPFPEAAARRDDGAIDRAISQLVDPTIVEEVTVTGSNIRGAPPASPVLTLSAAALERTGHATIADALRALPENFGGLAAESNNLTGADGVGRNTAFGTGLNLRGLGNGATLVLINGRRVAGSGTFADFVDISTIPTSAVARVEVLLDGASAVYGSDAVAGVVNIILRKPFDGGETRLLAGSGTAGEPLQAQIAHTVGRRWSDGGIVMSYELQRRHALRTGTRDFSRSSDLRPFGGSDFRVINSFPGNILRLDPVTNGQVPGFAIPAGQSGLGLRPTDLQAGVINLQNQRSGADILPRQTMNALYVAVEQTLGRLEVNADARWSYRRFKARGNPVSSTFTVGRGNPFFVSPNGSATHSIAYSFAGDLPNPYQAGSAEALSMALDAALSLGPSWRADGYLSLAQEIDEAEASGFVNSLILGEALGNVADRPDTAFNAARDGFFNPFTGIPGSNRAAVMSAIGTGATWARSRSRMLTANLQVTGTLFELPGGPLKIAAGGQARREELLRAGMNYLSTPAPVAFVGTDADRDVLAGYAEARVPLFGAANARPGLQRLELSLAGRVERYDLAGSTANPSVGIVWQPLGGLQLRGTYSRSFRAPALREVFEPAGLNPVLLSRGAARVRTLQLTGGNPDLDPETADAWTVGFDLTPAALPGLRLSATLFDARFENRIGRPASVNSANALVDPTLAPFVRFISPNTNAADLAIITEALASAPFNATNGIFPATDYGAIVDVRYVNTTTLRVRGLDVTGSYRFDVGDGDRVELGGNVSYLFDYKQQFTPASPIIDTVNVANFPLRLRGRTTADWTRGPLTLGGALNYTGRYRDTLGNRIGAFLSLDLQARVAPAESGPLRNVAVLLSVRNAFDRDPPFYNNSTGFAYDPANADPIGRFVSLQLTRTW